MTPIRMGAVLTAIIAATILDRPAGFSALHIRLRFDPGRLSSSRAEAEKTGQHGMAREWNRVFDRLCRRRLRAARSTDCALLVPRRRPGPPTVDRRRGHRQKASYLDRLPVALLGDDRAGAHDVSDRPDRVGGRRSALRPAVLARLARGLRAVRERRTAVRAAGAAASGAAGAAGRHHVGGYCRP